MQPNIFEQQVPNIFVQESNVDIFANESSEVDIFSEEQPDIFEEEYSEDVSIFSNSMIYAWEDQDESNENIQNLLQNLEYIANQLKQDPDHGVLGDLIINALLLTNV